MIDSSWDFCEVFFQWTGHEPLPWQVRLFNDFVAGRFPGACDIPTGLGKTAAIAIWLLALAKTRGTDGFPRRLVYVVNRRTVVDQATREVERLRERLSNDRGLACIVGALRSMAVVSEGPLIAISTLRGQFADNAEWREDPARPAVVIGTVDMIGSRLLFSAYGRGFRSKPLHAGFLGQDALIVHDEAHLEPVFQALLTRITAEQARGRDLRPIRVMALTATARTDERASLRLQDDDFRNDLVQKRFRAKKWLFLHRVEERSDVVSRMIGLARNYRDDGCAILVFVRAVEDVEKVAAGLPRGKVQRLTGTMRGYERDRMVRDDPVFARFQTATDRNPAVTPEAGTVFLVCTSAGEVGINISADHMICDLSTLDSMVQRLGRVNRFGEREARIDVVHPAFTSEDGSTEASGLDAALERTLGLLQRLPRREDGMLDASPAALADLRARTCPSEWAAAFAPSPIAPPVSDFLFDAWALTSVREELPGRPPVADWLHGLSDWEPPEAYVAWRDEVEVLEDRVLSSMDLSDLLDDYPLKPQEILRDRADRVLTQLKKLGSKYPASRVWLVSNSGRVEVLTLGHLIQERRADIAWRTVILPPSVGGLREGMLDGSADPSDSLSYDVSDQVLDENGERLRCRVWDDDPRPPGMRVVRTIDTLPEADEEEGLEEPVRRYWYWLARSRGADDDHRTRADKSVPLDEHLNRVRNIAKSLVCRLGLPETIVQAVVLAAGMHDLGKAREVWQLMVGNEDTSHPLAKSSTRGFRPDLTRYRHELGSLMDAKQTDGAGTTLASLSPDELDLVLHLIAAHHGRARPHFFPDETFDPNYPDDTVALICAEVPGRFARLQRRYGRWGLAYLESLVRAADILASREETQ